MITPKEYKMEDFVPISDTKVFNTIKDEDLSGADLIDNLIILRFLSVHDIRGILSAKHGIDFTWLQMNPTPTDLHSLSRKYGVLFERSKELVCYVPLGATVDDASLLIDIPNQHISFRYIADCNYNQLTKGLDVNRLSRDLCRLRPLAVFKRLIIDCLQCGGTDVHFESFFVDKIPKHKVSYRIKRELVDSKFKIDLPLMNEVILEVISKCSTASSIDLDSSSGVLTDIPNIFKDSSCDLRLTGSRTAAGLYVVCAIQNISTTSKTIDELGFPEVDVIALKELSKRRTGLTLITGEMRSGKNTTATGMLNTLVSEPIRIVEYSNPIEIRMPFPQINYAGNIDLLLDLMSMAKKQDIDIAVLNEIPDSRVAFAVRDLVNSAVGVITTTHIDRVWHLPYKLEEFFGKDYKTVISQVNAVINHKMFRRVVTPGSNLQRRTISAPTKDSPEWERNFYNFGGRQYYVLIDREKASFELQPLVEIMVLSEEEKTAILNFDEQYKAEDMMRIHAKERKQMLEYKVADFINRGYFLIDEWHSIM